MALAAKDISGLSWVVYKDNRKVVDALEGIRDALRRHNIRKTNKFVLRTCSSVKNHTAIATKSTKEEDVPR